MENRNNIDDHNTFKFKEVNSTEEFKEMTELLSKLSADPGKALEEIRKANIEDLKGISKEFKIYINNLINKSSLDIDFQEIEKLDSITPTKYVIPNNRLINKLVEGALLPGDTDLIVSNKLKKQVLTKVTLNYDDDNIEIYDKDKRFTPYDRSVHNSICSIYEAGNINFTPNQVYRCMNGLSEGEYVSPQAIGSITRSIDKTRRTYAKVNYTDEAKAWNKEIDNCIIEDHILSAKKVTLEAGGNEVTGYKLNSKPILYEYAQVTGQVLTIPSNLLNTKGFLNSTPEVTIIREYLIREIEWMKAKKSKRTNKILLIGIYKEIDLLDPTKEKAKKVRDSISKILDSFKDDKYIKSYKFYKEGRSFKGIEINY